MTEREIFEIENTRPHVVILGAGATIATIPNGDKNGNPCSVMHGFIHNLGLDTILATVKLNTKSENIEEKLPEILWDLWDGKVTKIIAAHQITIYR